jgi:Predicted transcriptional regulators
MLTKRGLEIQNAMAQFSICNPILLAIVDEARQQIIVKLAAAGPEGLCVNDITETADLSRPAISHHLKVLKASGLIKSRKKGTQIYYYLYLDEKIEALSGLMEALDSLLSVAKKDKKARDVTSQDTEKTAR